MKNVKIFTTAALVCCFMVCFAAIADISGKWTGTLKDLDGSDVLNDGNQVVLTYTFKVDGDQLTGSASQQGDSREYTLDSGKVDGNKISFSVTDPNGVVIPHSGTYYGDSIAMNLIQSEKTFHVTLKRVKN